MSYEHKNEHKNEHLSKDELRQIRAKRKADEAQQKMQKIPGSAARKAVHSFDQEIAKVVQLKWQVADEDTRKMIYQKFVFENIAELELKEQQLVELVEQKKDGEASISLEHFEAIKTCLEAEIKSAQTLLPLLESELMEAEEATADLNKAIEQTSCKAQQIFSIDPHELDVAIQDREKNLVENAMRKDMGSSSKHEIHFASKYPAHFKWYVVPLDITSAAESAHAAIKGEAGQSKQLQ